MDALSGAHLSQVFNGNGPFPGAYWSGVHAGTVPDTRLQALLGGPVPELFQAGLYVGNAQAAVGIGRIRGPQRT